MGWVQVKRESPGKSGIFDDLARSPPMPRKHEGPPEMGGPSHFVTSFDSRSAWRPSRQPPDSGVYRLVARSFWPRNQLKARRASSISCGSRCCCTTRCWSSRPARCGWSRPMAAASHCCGGASAPPPPFVAWGTCVEQYGSAQAHLPVLAAVGGLCRGRGAERAIEVLTRHAPAWLVQLPGVVGPDRLEGLQRRAAGARRKIRPRLFR